MVSKTLRKRLMAGQLGTGLPLPEPQPLPDPATRRQGEQLIPLPVSAAAAAQGASAHYEVIAAGARPRLSLYDNASGTWTLPLEEESVYQFYLRKVVDSCSGCGHTSLYRQDVENHITNARANYEIHKGATTDVVRGPEGAQRLCSACGVDFTLKPQRAQKHIGNMTLLGSRHRYAEVETIKQFSLGPPATPPKAIANGGVSEVNQEVRSQQGRKRKRSRGRSRGR